MQQRDGGTSASKGHGCKYCGFQYDEAIEEMFGCSRGLRFETDPNMKGRVEWKGRCMKRCSKVHGSSLGIARL